jgi:hypothetical protein
MAVPALLCAGIIALAGRASSISATHRSASGMTPKATKART